ncbi:MAG: hypothetical protein ACYCPA_01320 [Acidithiobacillus sp.]
MPFPYFGHIPRTITLVVLAAAIPGVAMAQGFVENFPDIPLNTLRAANNEVGLAATGMLQNYQEALPSPSDTESGWMPGFSFKLSGMNPLRRSDASLLYFAVRYRYNSGGLSYQGFTLATHRPDNTTDQATMQQVSVRIGKGFLIGSRVMLTPYFLYRFQDWERNLQSALGQREHYEANSAGIGLMSQWTPTAHWVLTGDLAWAHGFSGTVHGTRGIISPILNLNPGSTLQAGLQVDYELSRPWHLYGGVQFTHFSYGGSAPFYGYVPAAGRYIGPLHEPASQTNLLGLDLGVAYHF